jgi:cyclopropane fatty-acyl-phospholipid synthase-like methyltransferase
MNNSTRTLKDNFGFQNPFKADPLAVKAMRYLKDGRYLLDVGCGEGADAVFFARKGFQVSALDNDKTYLSRFRSFIRHKRLDNITVINSDVLEFPYRKDFYDVINCLLVGCCMARSDFEKLIQTLKQTIKSAGVIIMSLRNYLDPEFIDYAATERMIEPNTFQKREECCKIRYYIEKNRLRECFEDFEILYYYEGYAPDKYREVSKHGDSYIICRKN